MRSPPLSHADILYVQVEGDGKAGAVRPLPDDVLEDVVERAVEKKRIPFISWIDVAGWELWDSRAKAKRLHSGISSERLLKLLPFPDESLLILTRRSAAAAADSPSPPSVASILASLPLPTSSSITRLSWPLKDKHSMPAAVSEQNFPFYLRFVNREDQCDECVGHFRTQFDGLDDAIAPTFDKVSMLKNRPVVTSAGGPGIGQPHLSPHYHIDVVQRAHVCVVLVLSTPD
jgi:hypothetical protein